MSKQNCFVSARLNLLPIVPQEVKAQKSFKQNNILHRISNIFKPVSFSNPKFEPLKFSR